ncbi:MAG: UbiD family decarboxylase [Candidatus Hadarchaeales archaeon]
MNFREFLKILDERGLLVKIKKPVDVRLETSTLMKMLDGRPLLFENVKGYEMRIAANVFSTRELVAVGLGVKREDLITVVSRAIDNPRPVTSEPFKGYEEIPADLSKIPILFHYPFDGGPYISAGIVVARHPELGVNMSYHRMMVIDKDKVVMRILPRDFNEFLKRGVKEFVICIGNQPAVALAAAISVELGKSELDIANALAPVRVFELNGHLVPEAEIVMIAEMTEEEHDEGPFLDLTETPDIVRKQRVARIKKIFLKKGESVYHALLPGGLEHKVLMGMPREPTIFREVNKVCECKDVLITPGGCSWLHAVVSIKKKAPDDGKKAIEAAFRGHKSLKHVWVVDDDIDIHDPHQVEWAMATRFQGDRDIVMKKEKGSSLDPSADPHTYMTTKVGFDLTIPWDKDPKSFQKPPLPIKLDPKDYL